MSTCQALMVWYECLLPSPDLPLLFSPSARSPFIHTHTHSHSNRSQGRSGKHCTHQHSGETARNCEEKSRKRRASESAIMGYIKHNDTFWLGHYSLYQFECQYLTCILFMAAEDMKNICIFQQVTFILYIYIYINCKCNGKVQFF